MRGLILRIAFVLLCLAAGVVPMTGRSNEKPLAGFPGWPAEWEGRPLLALPLSETEAQWSRNFPGQVGKFSDGRRELLIRWVTRGTRQLHSSTDCFRGLGYSLTTEPAMVDLQGRRWSCFTAVLGDRRFLLRERIADEHGNQWTDVSAWFWSVVLGQSSGPWWAVAVVERAPG